MNNKDKLSFNECLFIAWSCFIFIIGMGIGAGLATNHMRSQAVSKELAYYHPKTKAFTWQENQTNNNAPSH